MRVQLSQRKTPALALSKVYRTSGRLAGTVLIRVQGTQALRFLTALITDLAYSKVNSVCYIEIQFSESLFSITLFPLCFTGRDI